MDINITSQQLHTALARITELEKELAEARTARPEVAAIERPIRELIETASDTGNSAGYVGMVFRARLSELQALLSPLAEPKA